MTPQEELQALRASRNKQPLSAQEELKQLRDSRSRKNSNLLKN